MHVQKPPSQWKAFRRSPLAAAIALLATTSHAAMIETSDPDLRVRWDNTVKYSAAARTGKQSAVLLGSSNEDDGNRNFNRGLVSNRLDWFSELDVQRGNFGGRISAAAWYDSVYNEANDNPGFAGGGAPNQFSVPYNKFTDKTRDIHGSNAEVLDAFVFGRFELAGRRASMRLGQHSILWGESLFFGANAIGGAQSPVDGVKLLSVPNTSFKEATRPVPQISGQIELAPQVTLSAYYQFRWDRNRLPAVGSYFSTVDMNPEGGEQILLPQASQGGPFLDGNILRASDQRAKNSGQGGLQLRFNDDETDYGIYLVRFHSKNFQQIANLGVRSVIHAGPGGCVVPGSFPTGPASCGLVAPRTYQLAWHEGIMALGFSASRTFGPMNLAAEVSVRHNQDLASSNSVNTQALGGAATNNSDRPAYAVGRTAHLNLSTLWQVPATPLWREAAFTGEIAWNRVLKITKNPTAVDPNATRDAVSMRFVLEPTYRQVIPGVDIGVPIGLGYTPKGSRSMALGPGSLPASGGGDFNIGVNGSYLDVWRFSVTYTHFFGPEGNFLDANNNFSYRQAMKDRNFVALSVRRTF
ncbi:DUF1302 domain-containing protein [Denitromonas iodatirespirans]|uniref:DUF1302 family protein n=1 Tax=Denitromonas iodatirespirans TaxID=2795389 RepID=A0A944D8R6_DENI1|nr:DUF1302 family protein [Denitromonas iodatirespirans]MBT0960103.1 DUF1302 family protein [Denitromonas iodatirespirans]